MSINFMNKDLSPKLFADKVSCDGHEITNLVMPCSPGFLAESFIKPPVTITIKFPCNIIIEKIVINGKVGGQRSTGFAIYTASFRRQNCWLFSNSTDDDVAMFDSKIFMHVGHGYNASPSNCQYLFVTRHLKGDSMPCNDSLLPPFQLSHRLDKHLSSVSALALQVKSTLNGSAVAVRSVEVWGKPASDTPAHVVSRLNLLYNKKWTKTDCSGSSPAEPDTDCLLSKCENSESTTGNLAADIPDEFLDAITHDLMTLPILLPCGQTIDQTTLDRYIKEEGVWGRAPSDPFTGRAFTSLNRPVQNTHLKIRLDEFLLKHGHKWNSETLGRSNNGNNHQCSRLVEKPSRIPFKNIYTGGDISTQNLSSAKRMKLDLGQEARNETVRTESVCVTDCHEDRITTSLDAAIRATLSHLPSFTKDKDDVLSAMNQRTTNTNGCFSCGTEDVEHMYQLKCGHNICRPCLLNIMKSGQSTCSICGTTVHSHDATKIHLNRSDFLINKF